MSNARSQRSVFGQISSGVTRATGSFYGKLAIRVETATNVHASHSLDAANASGVFAS